MRQEKQLLLDDIKQQINDGPAFVLFSYLGLKANDAADLRGQIDQVGGYVEMVPRRILRKAASEAGVSLDNVELPGHIGMIFAGEDQIAAAKAVYAFGKDSKAMTVLGGYFDKKLCSADQVKQLSTLPDINGMRSQLLGLFEAPMAQTLSVMQAVLTSVCYALENKAKLDGSEG